MPKLTYHDFYLNGESYCLQAKNIADMLNIDRSTITHRMSRGWGVQQIIDYYTNRPIQVEPTTCSKKELQVQNLMRKFK